MDQNLCDTSHDPMEDLPTIKIDFFLKRVRYVRARESAKGWEQLVRYLALGGQIIYSERG